MSDSSAAGPRAGDIVVHHSTVPTAPYALRRYPQGDQFSFRTYEEALAAACTFAARERVDVWYEDESTARSRVAAYRPPETTG